MCRFFSYAQVVTVCNMDVTTKRLKDLKTINTPSKLIPYEQLFIQQFFHSGSLIPEQICYDHNPMFKLAHTVDIT